MHSLNIEKGLESAPPKIVAIGGGTGNYVVLKGLKHHTPNLTAIVAMTDSGGSSGRLRSELGQLPPGDIRQCLIALAPDEHSDLILRQLFDYRFNRGTGLEGHSFGNLFLAALTEVSGSIAHAILEAGRMLQIKGTVLPVTLTKTNLHAHLVDGTEVVGEASIDVRKEKPGVQIDYVYLSPKAYVHPPVAAAIEEADVVVMGPGDLYTSIIPNLLVDGVSDAIRKSRALLVYVCNLMTKPGESDSFKASDFVKEILEYLGSGASIDRMLLNITPFPTRVLNRYERANAYPVEADLEECAHLVPRIIRRPMLAAGAPLRHDSDALAQAIMEIASEAQVLGESTLFNVTER
ncbi:MAG: uridine diphosphate-N-acetylglucosamine-binding protein YvcK [Dehalococcoidia bacterium]